MTKLINLYGGPGSGKSTTAAWLFAKMKMQGLNVELVTEAAKDLVWEQNTCRLGNQLYILGEQSTRLLRLKDKVDYIVTDSPMLMQLCYGLDLPIHALARLITFVEAQFSRYSIWIERACDYDPVGRTQTCAVEADQVSSEIRAMVLGSGKNSPWFDLEVPWFDLEIQGNEDGREYLWNFVTQEVVGETQEK